MDSLKYVILYDMTALMCSGLLLVLLRNMEKSPIGKKTIKFMFQWILRFGVLLCLSDMVGFSLEGNTFPGCRALLYLADSTYLLAAGIMSMLWLRYTYLKMGLTDKVLYRSEVLCGIPVVALFVLLVVNPFTDIIFFIDADGFYHRGNLMFLQWLINFFYLLLAALRAGVHMLHEKNRSIRDEYRSSLIFSTIPAFGHLLQLLFVGVNAAPMSFVLAAVMVYLHSQQTQISVDELTGLNNRGAMNRYIDSTMGSMQLNEPLYLLMIDINHFKRINDDFGHLVGDQALVDTAEILKTVCNKMYGRLFLARYGGDEFVIAGLGRDPGETAVLRQFIREESEHMNEHNGQPYTLEMSVGVASGLRLDFANTDELISVADANMYTKKKETR